MNTNQKNILGELDNRIGANQTGLLFLFDQAGIPTGDVIKLQDLAKLRKASHEKFLDAFYLLYPETKATASPSAYVYSNRNAEYETYQEMMDRLGLDPNYRYYEDQSNFDSIENKVVSYKTILTYLGYGVAFAIVAWLLWYFYKKMK
jgi:hypothetical protein